MSCITELQSTKILNIMVLDEASLSGVLCRQLAGHKEQQRLQSEHPSWPWDAPTGDVTSYQPSTCLSFCTQA